MLASGLDRGGSLTRPEPTENPLDTAIGARARLNALGRFVAFVLLAIVLAIGGYRVVAPFIPRSPGPGDVTGVGAIVWSELALAILTVVIPTALMTLIGREPATRFGWGQGRRLAQLGLGAACGFGLMTALLIVIALAGGCSFGALALGPASAVKYGSIYAGVFVLVAISEEGLFRGYGLTQLSRAISFWPAAILTSLVFLALHMNNRMENPLGLVSAGLAGLILAYSFRRSGGLWFAWGFHAVWDYSETFIYGVPDSGVTVPGTLMRPMFHGPMWLTGGSAGPEGSLLVLPTLAALAVIAHVALRPARPAA